MSLSYCQGEKLFPPSRSAGRFSIPEARRQLALAGRLRRSGQMWRPWPEDISSDALRRAGAVVATARARGTKRKPWTELAWRWLCESRIPLIYPLSIWSSSLESPLRLFIRKLHMSIARVLSSLSKFGTVKGRGKLFIGWTKGKLFSMLGEAHPCTPLT